MPFPALPTAPEIAGKVPPEDNNLYIAADGTGDFYSIQRALDVAKEGQVLMVSPGEYREVVTVDKKNITIRSNNPDPAKTVVVFNKHAATDGGTGHTATVNVNADNFFAENITIQNDYHAPAIPYPQGSQAVALRVTGDRAVFHNVRLLGNQDTLYANGRGCEKGEAELQTRAAVFHQLLHRGKHRFHFWRRQNGLRELRDPFHSVRWRLSYRAIQALRRRGFRLRVRSLPVDAGCRSQRQCVPWPAVARLFDCVFMHTEMGDKIDPAGWSEWHAEVSRTLDTAYYAEFDSTGPGAHHAERDRHTHFLTPEEAKQYEPAIFLRGTDNWNPLELPKPAEQ